MISHEWWVVQSQTAEREWRAVGGGFETEELAWEYVGENNMATGWYGAPVSVYKVSINIYQNKDEFPVKPRWG